MNTLSRIKKMEAKVRISEFCGCRSTPKFEIEFYKDGKPAASLNPHKYCVIVPDICPSCGKAVEKELLIIDGISSNIPKPLEAQ